MRTPFIAGNWKMHKTVSEAVEIVDSLKKKVKNTSGVEMGVCPPFTALGAVRKIIDDSQIVLGAQNMHYKEEGAFTGEISASMLREAGCSYVILGHSERRELFGETDEGVNRKVKKAFSEGLKPIICVGESLKEREAGYTFEKVSFQVRAALQGLGLEEIEEAVIAYEPLWAIGTGESASAEDAAEVIGYIREIVSGEYGKAAAAMRIQYGGSVKPHNIQEFMSMEDIDGALVGGASLEADSFAEIILKTEEG